MRIFRRNRKARGTMAYEGSRSGSDRGWLPRLGRRLRQWRGIEPRTRVDLRVDAEVWGGWRILPQLVAPGDVVYSFDMGGDLVLERLLLDRLDARIYMFDPGLADAVKADGELFERFRLAPVRVGAEPRPAVTGQGPRGAEIRRLGGILETHGHHRLSLVKLNQGSALTAAHDIVEGPIDIRQLLISIPDELSDRRARVEAMVASLRGVGYRIFDIAPDGSRYSFLRTGFRDR